MHVSRTSAGPAAGSTFRLRAFATVGAGAGALGVALVRLHQTRGIDVAPFPLCPFHAVTGLWCPFCGSLRAVADLTHLDLAAALSSNLLVVLLVLPAMAVALGLRTLAALTGRPTPQLLVTNRTWAVLGVLFLVFAVWRNLPQLPLGAWLGP